MYREIKPKDCDDVRERLCAILGIQDGATCDPDHKKRLDYYAARAACSLPLFSDEDEDDEVVPVFEQLQVSERERRIIERHAVKQEKSQRRQEDFMQELRERGVIL